MVRRTPVGLWTVRAQKAVTARMSNPASWFPNNATATIATMKTRRRMSANSDRTCPSDLSTIEPRNFKRIPDGAYSAAAMELMTEEI